MVKIYLKLQQINDLLQWRDENKDLVREKVIPFPECEIISKENGIKIRAEQRYIFINTSNIYDFTVSDTIAHEVKGRFCYSTLTNVVTPGVPQLSHEDIQTAITVWASVMAYIVNFRPEKIYDNENAVENIKNREQRKKGFAAQKKNRVIYLNKIIHCTNKKITRKHTEPNYSFSVRGHYRHLQSGKIVYVHPYKKYEHKNKDSKAKIFKIKEV